MLQITSPGPLTTVQDMGRYGSQNMGFSPAGAMDTRSLALGNLLVGNAPGEAALEMTMGGISAVFYQENIIAFTGADVQAAINGEPVPRYQAIAVKRFDVLTCSFAKSGMRAYLCVSGGFDLPEALGSRSTSLKFKLGGLDGRKLQAGDVLPFRRAMLSIPRMASRRLTPEDWGGDITLRAVLGPQEARFTGSGIRTFLTAPYTITAESDRMGCRLDGPVIEHREGADVISDGIVFGSVQVPSGGKPIVLMADRQTTGGYTKIATVASVDLPRLAQARPGQAVRFAAISVREAEKLHAAELRYYRTLSHWKGWLI